MNEKKPKSTYQRGQKGEARATQFLRLKGYRILEKNFRVPQGEIDLIAKKRGVVVFVEVKSRENTLQGSPLEAVSPHKVRRLSAAAALYLASHREEGLTCRFDVVALGPEKNWWGSLKVRHLENAFSVGENYNI